MGCLAQCVDDWSPNGLSSRGKGEAANTLYSGDRRVEARRTTTERQYAWHFAKYKLMIKASKIITVFLPPLQREYIH